MKKQQKSKDLYKNLKLLKKSYFTFFTICVLLNVFMKNLISFASSILFTITIMTTVGYGHISPGTMASKMFCIVYALVGE